MRGSVDFVFGNATAVIDKSTLHMLPWPGGTILAPNTDYRKKYGILITHSSINSTALSRTMYFGRPWHNSPEAHPQAVIRETLVSGAVDASQPWTNMTPDYPRSWARFKEYKNTGGGAGFGANAPKLTDAEAADFTAAKYLAGSDGWNPTKDNALGSID
ncbi:pectinesterase family protein [Streptomyces sp. R28]|uniref:Pectinesterase family protein n=1 Tax=Streptomyces sp. R28 TaxID=3238628 RepID=A0AB39QD54_9ACTN